MGRRRKKNKTLTGSRIYPRRKDYWYEPKEPVLDPATGKVGKYHKLCPITAGEHAARCRVQRILGTATPKSGSGDFATWFPQWRDKRIAEQNKDAPTDPERLKMHQANVKNTLTWYRHIEKALCDFDVAQIRPVDISQFLGQWEGKRTAQVLLSYLSMFLQWCAGQGVINTNPAREVKVKKPRKRTVHITDEQFEAVRLAAPASGHKHKDGTRSIDHDGQMLQIYVELLYLLGQRGADVRLLRWDAISEGGILVTPTKTEGSSGKTVLLPMTAAITEVLNKAKSLATVKTKKSPFVIHDRKGGAYEHSSLNSRFNLVRRDLHFKGFTLKDIRPKMATDAHEQGYNEEDLKTALVHTDTATTRGYLRRRAVEVSNVRMELPSERKRAKLAQRADEAPEADGDK